MSLVAPVPAGGKSLHPMSGFPDTGEKALSFGSLLFLAIRSKLRLIFCKAVQESSNSRSDAPGFPHEGRGMAIPIASAFGATSALLRHRRRADGIPSLNVAGQGLPFALPPYLSRS